MKRTHLIVSFLIVTVSLMLFLCACDSIAAETNSEGTALSQTPAAAQPEACVSEQPTITPTPAAQCSPVQTADSVSAAANSRLYPWVVYWDYDTAIYEIGNISPVMGSISVFAAYFNGDDGIIFPQTSEDTLQAVRDEYGSSVESYLTFVNDILYENDSSSLKDVDLLRRLFSSPARMNAHIDEIIALAKAKGFSGIEIDYENMKKDEALRPLFVQFLTALNDKAKSEGLKLRVVLETSDLGKASYPAGPAYTVMVYNLYGNHSCEPGPKADEDFILETAAKSVCLGPNVCFAFATGGFDWTTADSVTSLSETDAADLAQTTQSSPERDIKSGALHFTYQNETAHTVWYADGETLCFWMQTAKEVGIKNFALWRLGGNSENSLRMITDYLDDNA